MEDKLTYYKNTSKMLKKRYVIAVIILILSLLVRQVIISYEMNHNEHLASVINVAGRQRMLGQKIVKDALAIYELENSEASNQYYKDLRETVQLCETLHSALQRGEVIQDEPMRNSSIVNGLYEQLEDSHMAMMMAAHEIIAMSESNNDRKADFKMQLDIILENEPIYLEGMERIVDQYDSEAKEKVHQLKALELIMFVVLLIVIIFEVIAIFLPTNKALLRIVGDITESSRNLLTLIQSVSEELFLLEADSLEIILMNETARQLLAVDAEDKKRRYFAEEIEWGSEEKDDIPRKIKEEDKVNGIEVSIKKKTGEIMYSKLSTVKGNYMGKSAILIILSDITSQKREEENIRKQAIKDELTGLYNRHFMDEIVVEELDRADRYNFPISVFIMDIDFFKRVNDTWGHPVGDIILKHTSELTLKNIRKSDFLVRFGGEEFLLFMPHIDLKHAMVVAEKVRKEIEQYTHPVVGKYTASFGVAERKKGETFQSLYQRADAAMYRAKQEGRNRVVADTHQDILQSKVLHLNWREEWNSGNEKIDHQHKELLEMINQIANLTLSDAEDGVIKEKMDVIIHHTMNHFEEEEAILKKVGYPYYKNHANIHTSLLTRAKEFERAYFAGEVKLTAFFTFLLDEVIVGHLLDMDTKFFPYVKNENEEV